jgi:hypothetical protein
VTVRHIVFLVGLQLLGANGRVIDFDRFAVGQTPPGWTVAMTNRGTAPKWEVRQDQTAPTKPYVLAQTSTDPAVDRFPLAILDGVSFRDGDVSVRIKAVASEHHGGGVVWRYRDERNYYLVRATATTISVIRVQDGRPSPIVAPVKHDIPANGWSILKVSARGNRFQIYVDHRRILEGQDTAFQTAGKVGLCTASESVMYFDDFRVYPR